MKRVNILHLGIGNVGKEVMIQIAKQKGKIAKDLGILLEYIETFTSKDSDEEIRRAIQSISLPFMLIDTTASDKTVPYIAKALKRRGFAVLANKKPLAREQKDFDLLHKLGSKRLFYECVVGAGLPVIRTLKDLLMTGDEIVEIQGCFSGTLGFLFTQMEGGNSFSESVMQAAEKGFTEPDPRDDVSGLDVARKALILVRLLGRKMELDDVKLTPLYPKDFQSLPIDDFLRKIHQLDGFYKKKMEKAKQENKVLRYVAKISPGVCKVGLTEVGWSSDMGSLQGPDNLIIFKTKRYLQNSLVIKGPGAGIAVTAAGVFSDILSVAKLVCGGRDV